MGSARDLPPSLELALRRCGELERLARTDAQRARARRSTLRLLRAAYEAGWRATDLADAVGINAKAAHARIAVDRRRCWPTGVEIEPPLSRPHELATLAATPIAEREWMTLPEARDFAGVDEYSIRNWLSAGILPNTRRVTGNRNLYARPDMLRVMRAPRYKNHGVSYEAVRASIAAHGV